MPPRRHLPTGARLRDLHREFGLVDPGDDEAVARRIFERDVNPFAIDLDMLLADLDLVRRAVDRHLPFREIGRASCRERVCQYVEIQVVCVSLKKKTKQGIDRKKNNKTK